MLIIGVTWAARHRPRVAVGVLFAVVALSSLATSPHLLTTNTPLAYFSLQSRAWELTVGGALAVAVGALGRLPVCLVSVMTWAGLAAIVVCALVYDDRILFPGVAALWPVLETAAVIAGGCTRSERGAQAVLGYPVLQGIGTISYAWYLWHWPVLILTPVIIGRPMTLPESLEMAFASLWISVVSYSCIEAQTLRGPLRRRPWILGGAALVIVVALSAHLALVSAPTVVGQREARPVVLAAGADSTTVKVAVSRSLSETSVPSNLAPALDAARDDEPATSRDGCHAEVLAIDQLDCVFGDPAGTRTMVLFGDSHAQQWFPALDAQARTLGWRLVSWTKSGCPIADQEVYSQQLGREYTECARWREATVARIVLLDRDVVVVSQSDTLTLGQSARRWTDGTASTLGRFQQAGVPSVYLLDTPAPSEDVPACAASHLRNTGACVIPRDEASPKGRHKAMDAALRDRSITTLDPFDMFCGVDACPPIVGNVLVYRDESHMSASYARFLVPATPRCSCRGPDASRLYRLTPPGCVLRRRRGAARHGALRAADEDRGRGRGAALAGRHADDARAGSGDVRFGPGGEHAPRRGAAGRAPGSVPAAVLTDLFSHQARDLRLLRLRHRPASVWSSP